MLPCSFHGYFNWQAALKQQTNDDKVVENISEAVKLIT